VAKQPVHLCNAIISTDAISTIVSAVYEQED